MKLEVLPPNINESFEDFAVILGEDKQERIRFGLNAVKNVGANVAHEFVEERKRFGEYTSLADLLERVASKDLNKKSLEALAKVGALDDLEERGKILANLEAILSFSKTLQKNKESSQVSLFGESILAPATILLPEAPPATKKERLQWEKELLGLYVSDHPASEYREYLESVALPISELTKDSVGKKIRLGGIITKVKKIILKNQKSMAFVQIEDFQGKIELLVFPKILEKTGALWREDALIVAEGSISDKDDALKLLVDAVKEITPTEIENWKRISATQKNNFRKEQSTSSEKIVLLMPPQSTQETLKKLSAFLDQCPAGNAKVYLRLSDKTLETPYHIQKTPHLAGELEKIIPGSQLLN
jgi:DNA polymerase-3 subunit alpha